VTGSCNKPLVRRLLTALVAALLACAPAAYAAGDPLRAQQWNLDLIGADGAHSVTRGEGAVVAVLDTGVDASHEDLSGRLLPGANFVPGETGPEDEDGHGTHVTGIVAANAGNGLGVASVAPGARVLPVRVLGADGGGSDTDVAKGIDYAIAQKADVINLSLGGNALSAFMPGGEFAAAIQRAVDAGIVVVAAAGNDSLPICEQPRIRGQILCVGAVDKRGLRSFFSSGDSASVMAPGGSGGPRGEDVLSTVPGSRYAEIAGTSQAAPHVSGVAALLVSRGVRGQAAIDRIRATARDAGVAGRDPVYGDGILDAQAAVAGLGGGGSASGGSGSSGSGAGSGVVLRRVQAIRSVVKRGIRARCLAKEGACTVLVRRGKTVLARGRGTGVFTVRLTPAGKRLLKRARSLRATAVVQAPGGAKRTLRITFKR
jgi:serine protease